MKRRIRKELLDELLAGYTNPEDLTGPDGLLKQLTGALVERALSAELTDHLGHEPGGAAVNGNMRNGTTVQRHPVFRTLGRSRARGARNAAGTGSLHAGLPACRGRCSRRTLMRGVTQPVRRARAREPRAHE